MKFKRIEISAFRIYDRPEDSTFDFTTKDGETADFISLYAPNGFGKTSLYDAVEWGITNSISRFAIRQSENESLYTAQKSLSKAYFIRNTKSDEKLETKVKIFTTQNSFQQKWKPRKNAKYETSFKLLSHDFQKVILSQDWISSFLTEVDGEERYNRFKDLPGLIEIDTYYKNVLALSAELLDRITNLNNSIQKLKSQLNPLNDQNLLVPINKQIELINEKYGYNFDFIDKSFSDEQLYKFKNNVRASILSDIKKFN